MYLSDFELLSFIGRGGYGDVWLARGQEGRHWAVKIVYRSSFDDDRPYEREYKGILRFFPVSAKSESQLRVMHVGRRDDDGCFYYIMELADDASGAEAIRAESYTPHTLRSELRQRRRIPATEVCALGWSLTNALENLHANGLVHRDIKPGNIIFVGGRPKLADVGLVTDADLTRTFAGTEGYIPPEGPGTYRADIYSLGMTLYEACTGCDRREFPALPENVAELPDHAELLRLIRVVNRACQPDRRRRYQTAAEVRGDLESLLRGGAVAEGRGRGRYVLPVAAGGLGLVAAMVLWSARDTAGTASSESTNPPMAVVPGERTNHAAEPPPNPPDGDDRSRQSVSATNLQDVGPGDGPPPEGDTLRQPVVRSRVARVAPTAVSMPNPKERKLQEAKQRLEEAKNAWNQATAARYAAEGNASRVGRRNRRAATEAVRVAQVTEERALRELKRRQTDYDTALREYSIFQRGQLPR